ncbi:hypothetical protein HBB16_05195 [Pseudonocardia sp. MCCB 268]|nr:hypothetical protein [Pseudonocardia cytotoxica]
MEAADAVGDLSCCAAADHPGQNFIELGEVRDALTEAERALQLAGRAATGPHRPGIGGGGAGEPPPRPVGPGVRGLRHGPGPAAACRLALSSWALCGAGDLYRLGPARPRPGRLRGGARGGRTRSRSGGPVLVADRAGPGPRRRPRAAHELAERAVALDDRCRLPALLARGWVALTANQRAAAAADAGRAAEVARRRRDGPGSPRRSPWGRCPTSTPRDTRARSPRPSRSGRRRAARSAAAYRGGRPGRGSDPRAGGESAARTLRAYGVDVDLRRVASRWPWRPARCAA